MSWPAWTDDEFPVPDFFRFVIEDDERVDNLLAEKQQRLLTSTLYASWEVAGRTFVALSNVGLYPPDDGAPFCPDVMVALDVDFPSLPDDRHLSYYVSVQRKPPDVVIEIVTDRDRGEEEKIEAYARMDVPYYVIFDVENRLDQPLLRVLQLIEGRYEPMADPVFLPELGLGLTLWDGEFEGCQSTWLRWIDARGELLPTASEVTDAARAERDAAHAQLARLQAELDVVSREAACERRRAQRLAARLRALGLEPGP